MGIEIERRFLVRGEVPEGGVTPIAQAYLSVDPERTVRVRLAGERAWLTVKGRLPGAGSNDDERGLPALPGSGPEHLERSEFEYEIPVPDAHEMFEMGLGAPIYKSRVRVPAGGGLSWEIDVFYGENEGLVVAEIELGDAGQEFEHPGWLGDELTGDPRLTNATLVMDPIGSWGQGERERFVRPRLSLEGLRELSRFQLGLRPVSELELTARGAHFLARRGIASVGQLLNATKSELTRSGGVADEPIAEIEDRLGAIGAGLAPG